MKGGISMKKSIIIVLIIIAIIIAIFGIILVSVFVNLTKEKTPMTASSFKNSMEQKGYIVSDANSQISEYDYIKQVYVAVDSDYSYKIEFYELSDENYAMNFYNTNKSIFESSKGNASAETSAGLKNYSKYTLSSNGKYMVVSRIDNTVVYLNVDDSYKDTVNNLLNELGY